MQNLFKEYEGIFEAENAEESPDTKQKKERVYAYSPFALQNAIGDKSAKKVWIEYEQRRLADITAEELIFNIINKTRDMLAIKSFGAKNWKEEDLKSLYTKLVEIYHKSRMESGNELDIALEKTLLSI